MFVFLGPQKNEWLVSQAKFLKVWWGRQEFFFIFYFYFLIENFIVDNLSCYFLVVYLLPYVLIKQAHLIPTLLGFNV